MNQDQQEIFEHIKEFLHHHNMSNTIECIEAEQKTKNASNKLTKKNQNSNNNLPKICQIINPKNKEQYQKQQTEKYTQVLQAGRQIFAVSINLLQLLHSLKDKNENISETIENYKIQLGKHHKVILNDGKPEGLYYINLKGSELITETVIQEHKQKLINNFQEKNIEGMVEVLLSLRVNSLQIAPELRKNLVNELIRNDILLINENQKFEFIIALLSYGSSSLKHAITSLISVISSTIKGVEYLTSKNNMIVIENIIKIMKQQENGNVTQRFCLAILQKSSIKETVIPCLVQNDLINWTVDLCFRAAVEKINVFCLDFSSAMLANIIHTPSTLHYLEKNSKVAQDIMNQMLKLMKEKIPVSVLMHILISLSYMSKECFEKQMEKCKFVEKINDFVEQYSQINTDDNEAADIDKKTVLDLCAHMFHPKESSQDNSDNSQDNEQKNEEKIKEYENEQGELIFECFQDEVS